MRCTISQDKALKFLEWIFFTAFFIVAGWFASGVLQQFFSQKTSFSQNEGEIKKHPVLSIVFSDYKASKVNLSNNVNIFYWTKGVNRFPLEIGENHLENKHADSICLFSSLAPLWKLYIWLTSCPGNVLYSYYN